MTALRMEFRNAVVLGGNGAMGSLLCENLGRQLEIVVALDLEARPRPETRASRYVRSDVLAPNGEAKRAIAAADLVILALPEPVAIAAIPGMCSLMHEGSLLVDTLSVKSKIADSIRSLEPPIEALGINPMFGPSLGFDGQNVIAVEFTGGPRAQCFIEMLESWGCRVEVRTAAEHDRATAALQSATHAAILSFGMALEKLNYDLSALAGMSTPPHRVLLALLARVVSGDPDVYWAIQARHPFAEEARDAVRHSVAELSELVANGNEPAFREVFDRLRHLLGAEQEPLAHRCAALFDAERRAAFITANRDDRPGRAPRRGRG